MEQRNKINFIDNWWFNLDKKIFFIYVFLCLFGLIAVLTASPAVATRINMSSEYSFFIKQLIFLSVSFVVCIVISTFDNSRIKIISILYFIASFILLTLVPITGNEYKGAKRWLSFRSVSIQPMEFVKTATILPLAYRYSVNNRQKQVNFLIKNRLKLLNQNRQKQNLKIKKQFDINDYEIYLKKFGITKNEFKTYISRFDLIKVNIATILLVIAVFALLLHQPDLGNSFLLFMVIVYQFALYKNDKLFSIIKISIVVLLFCVPIIYFSFSHFRERINNYFISVLDIDKALYQVRISTLGYRNSGFVGKGFLAGEIKNHIPDSHTDFIFPVIAEEFGFAVILLLLCVYFYLSIRILLKSLNYKDDFVFYSLNGLAVLFILQTIINISVSVNLAPAKGMTLPLLSYGGSSILANSIVVGFILAMTKKNQQNFYREKYFVEIEV